MEIIRKIIDLVMWVFTLTGFFVWVVFALAMFHYIKDEIHNYREVKRLNAELKN